MSYRLNDLNNNYNNSKMKKYKENIKNFRELLEKERMKKRLNKSLCYNLYLNIRKEMSNYINEINKSFEKNGERQWFK